MSEDVVVAEAPVDAVADEALVPPNPLTDPQDKPAEPAKAPEKPLSARESLERAAAKVDKAEKDGEATDKAKPLVAGPQKDPATGKFLAKPSDSKEGADAAAVKTAAKVASSPAEPPARFSADAKAAWATAPEPVKAEVHRAVRELETGLQEHQKRWEPLKEFDDLAKKSGTTLDRALKEYVGIDKMLGENFPAAMQRICANKGVDIRSFAADVLGLNEQARQQLQVAGRPQQVRTQSSNEIALQKRIDALEQQIGGVTGTIQQQRSAEAEQAVAQFAADKPLFNELSSQIAQHIANDGLSLSDAYAKAFGNFQAMAATLGLKPQNNNGQAQDDLAAQTLKGQKSIAGAPSAGSTPATQKPSSSIKDALRKAMASVG